MMTFRMAPRRWAPRAVLLAVVALAVGRAATASTGRRPPPITPQLARRAYVEITSHEPGWRRNAALSFPGDPWSADDDVHEHEYEEIVRFGARTSVPVGDVLRALDDGMHEKWRAPADPIAEVPPCRPRLVY